MTKIRKLHADGEPVSGPPDLLDILLIGVVAVMPKQKKCIRHRIPELRTELLLRHIVRMVLHHIVEVSNDLLFLGIHERRHRLRVQIVRPVGLVLLIPVSIL